jgi:hypothetical protein
VMKKLKILWESRRFPSTTEVGEGKEPSHAPFSGRTAISGIIRRGSPETAEVQAANTLRIKLNHRKVGVESAIDVYGDSWVLGSLAIRRERGLSQCARVRVYVLRARVG